MHLTKHHALGNDFLIAFVDRLPGEAADLARLWCNRHTGLGADGLIFATPNDEVDLTMTLLNADGGVAEISGNGIRCLAQAVARSRGAERVELVIESAGQRRALQVLPASEPATACVTAEMGPVGCGPNMMGDTNLGREGFSVLRAATGDVGNPHVIIEVDDLDRVDPTVDGPAIEALWAPIGINVHFVRVSGPDELTLLHWERGSGATLACGSGATVAATVAQGWGSVGHRVSVKMPGGTAEVAVGPRPTLSSTVVHVADIEVSDG